jgi:deoxycytidine triphosphate deaminase
MIEGCREENIQPVSVDLTLGKVFRIKAKEIVDIDENTPDVEELSLPHILAPGEYVLGRTFERIDQKRTRYGILVVPRSRTFRIGLQISTGLTAPNYRGEIVFGIRNASQNRIRLDKGMGLIQLVFFDVKSDIIPLQHRYQDGRVI